MNFLFFSLANKNADVMVGAGANVEPREYNPHIRDDRTTK